MTVLRCAVGVIWAFNLVYIVDPANQFFATFASTAQGFGASSLGGPKFAAFVAANPLPFALMIVATTAFLAVSFLSGFALRVACVVGFGSNVALLLTQFTLVATIPGGTDVGPQPLYLAIYPALFVGAAPTWSRSAPSSLRTVSTRLRRASA